MQALPKTFVATWFLWVIVNAKGQTEDQPVSVFVEAVDCRPHPFSEVRRTLLRLNVEEPRQRLQPRGLNESVRSERSRGEKCSPELCDEFS